jgi:hypothetical protein
MIVPFVCFFLPELGFMSSLLLCCHGIVLIALNSRRAAGPRGWNVERTVARALTFLHVFETCFCSETHARSNVWKVTVAVFVLRANMPRGTKKDRARDLDSQTS